MGQHIGTSDWVTIDQNVVDQFAACTGDNQFIHVDPQRARDSPFGGTIAHGLLTLSILASLQRPFLQIEGTMMTVNYGFNRIRFVRPVPVGASVRGAFTLDSMREVNQSAIELVVGMIAEVDTSERPGIVAQLVLRKHF